VKCKQINKMARGDSSEAPNSLMNLITTYWKENFDVPPDVAAIDRGQEDTQNKAAKLSVSAMREMLLKAHHGDSQLCNQIKKAPKGNTSTQNTLVHMICLMWNVSSSSSSSSS
jgi:hypothetical protein